MAEIPGLLKEYALLQCIKEYALLQPLGFFITIDFGSQSLVGSRK